ncbi:hypothetical protein [Streptomyces sp. TR06-5]|uniref:hypothetical protein n=1 Tax=Streptomyces sp. TR06-5 TaxID=3385976 RepID=UPI0039A231F8
MTACAVEVPAGDGGTLGRAGFVITADGSYGARLAQEAGDSGGWRPERWTLDGPEPYAVPLPCGRPEEPATQVQPLADGRVLVARRDTGAHRLALLYPSGPSTGEAAVGTVDSEWLALLPPAPGGRRAYALVASAERSQVWLVSGEADAPRRVAEVAGRCTGGAWLDREARLLALDRTDPGNGTTKTVVVDLGLAGRVSPLLQITDDSEDRLLLADPDSGLLLLRSDAPGGMRLGWGVLGSSLPVRFPDSLCPDGVRLAPFAVQPGKVLTPETCAVALRADGPNGTWVAVWQPAQRRLRHVAAPQGWLPGSGRWTADGELRLPYATQETPCGLAAVALDLRSGPVPRGAVPAAGTDGPPAAAAGTPPRPVPLQQAPMALRTP